MSDSQSQSDVISTLASNTTLCEVFQRTVLASGDRPALRQAGDNHALTWRDVGDRVRAIAAGLVAEGIGPGDGVAILLRNLPEVHLIDIAALHLGAMPVSLYATDPLDRLAGVIDASDSTILVTEAAFSDRAIELKQTHPGLSVIVDIADSPFHGAMSLAELEQAPPLADFEARWRSVIADDTACVLFTSGTTGKPKGVELSHRAILASMAHYASVAPLTPNGRVLSYLPMAHIADRFASHYAGIAFGHTITDVPNHEDLFDTIRDVAPTHFFTVPRVLEKLGAAAADLVRESDAQAAVAERQRELHDQGFTVYRPLEQRDPRFSHVRSGLGLGQAEWMTVGSAPSSRGIVEMLAAIDLPFADIWGMTEIIVCTMNSPEEIRFGSIGRPFEHVQLRVAEDRELIATGPNQFSRFRNDPVRTQEAIDEHGWVLTGDLAEIDDAGYVRIVGRKKEIMINAAGKNLSPLEIEGALKSASPLIDHAAAIADGRRYVTALISLDRARLREFAEQSGLSGDFASLTREPAVLDMIHGAVERANGTLAKVEHVRRWTVVPDEWMPGSPEVTASMKLMRGAVLTRYADEIEELYPADEQ